MRNISDKKYRENQNTHFMFSKFFSEIRAIYEVIWKKYSRDGQAPDDNIIDLRRMRLACWITKAKYTHSEHVLLSTFPR